MSERRQMARIALSVLFNSCIIGVGVWATLHFTHATYQYTENIIVSEAARMDSKEVSTAKLVITENTTIEDIATVLYEEGCIANSDYFILEAKLEDITSGFIPGEYFISSNMSSSKILQLITTDILNEDETIKFTIPEGYTIDQIGEILEKKNIATKNEFIDAVKNRDYTSEYSFLKDIPSNSNYKYTLEGYLFPDTYIVHKDISSEEIIVMMLNRFEEIISRYSSYINASPYSMHELIAIASIVEQEAKLDEERSLISGVIYNRLNADIKLQMCSTVQYSLGKRKSTLTTKDLEMDSSYNTYLYDGLPIGPICNPGEACLKAAIMPSEHDYYFFVLQDADKGSHYFSQTMDEHINAKQQYRQSSDINFVE